MENEKIKQFIISQRQNGVSDESIHAFLVEKGAIQQPQQVQAQTTRKPITEKIADVTGGKELSQGFGQALAQRGTQKLIDETQKQQFDLQGKLVNQIKTAREQGRDTTRLENALNLLTEDVQEFGAGAEKLLNPNELTNKQVIGDALQLATTAGGAKVAGAVAGNAVGATTVGQGLIQGAKAGVMGGTAVGALSGASQGLQDDKDAMGILKSAGTGAVAGGVGGAVIGGAIGAVSGGIAGRAQKAQQKILDNVTPNANELTPTQYKKLLAQGKITQKTKTEPARYILSEQEKAVALRNSNLITKDPVKTVNNIGDEIARQDANVGQYLKSNNGIFNKGELKNYLRSSIDEISDISVDDKILSKNKDKFVNNFIKSIDKNDLETLWKTRKGFDQQIEKAFGSSSLSNKMKVELRNAVQDFISERTDDVTYKAAMKEMSGLFKLRDTVATRATKERARSAIQQWLKENPVKAKILGGLGATAIADRLGII